MLNFLKAFFLIWNLNFPLQAFAETPGLEIFSYGPPTFKVNGELNLLVDDLLKSKWSEIRLRGIERGLSYMSNGLYLIAPNSVDRDVLAKSNETFDSTTYVTYFETSRDYLVISGSAPRAFIEELKKYRNSEVIFHDEVRYWNDLSWGAAKFGISDSLGLPFYSFIKKNENSGDSRVWDTSIYVTYRLTLGGKEFSVTQLPKSFGGMTRVIAALKKLKTENGLALSLGNVTPPIQADELDAKLFRQLNSINNQYILAGFSEIQGFEKYFASPQNKKNFQKVISANVYKSGGNSKERLFAPYRIVTINHLKIAVVGITDVKVNDLIDRTDPQQTWLKNIVVKSPKEILEREILPELRNKADLILLLSNSNPKDFAEISENLEDIDLVFKNEFKAIDSDIKTSLQVKNFKSRRPRSSVFEIKHSENSLNITEIQISKNNLSLQSSTEYLDEKYQLGALNDRVKEDFLNLIDPLIVILPDHRKLYRGDKIAPSESEFSTLAAGILKTKTNSEIGLFKIQSQNTDFPAELDITVIKSWIGPREQLVVGYLKGSSVLQLLSLNPALEKSYQVSFSGVSNKKMVNGQPILAKEYYRIATTTGIAENLKKYTMFSGFEGKALKFIQSAEGYSEERGGNPVYAGDLILGFLAQNWREANQLEDEKKFDVYRRMYEDRYFIDTDGYWVHDLKNLRLEYSELKTNDKTDFVSVRDTKLKSTDQKIVSGYLSYSASFRKDPALSELGIKAEYSKLELKKPTGSDINTISDDLLFFANIGLPIFKIESVPFLASKMGPLSELVYDTEFESNPDEPYQRSIQGFVGSKFYNGTLFKSAFVSVFNENRLSESLKKNIWGLNVRFEIDKEVFDSAAAWRAAFDYKYYFSSNDDGNEDLRSRLVWDNFLDLRISKHFSFGPFLKLASFTGKTFNTTANQSVIGFNLSFAASWKPKYKTDLF